MTVSPGPCTTLPGVRSGCSLCLTCRGTSRLMLGRHTSCLKRDRNLRCCPTHTGCLVGLVPRAKFEVSAG